MWSAAPQTTLWGGPKPRFEPGTGDVEAGTLTTRPPHLLETTTPHQTCYSNMAKLKKCRFKFSRWPTVFLVNLQVKPEPALAPHHCISVFVALRCKKKILVLPRYPTMLESATSGWSGLELVGVCYRANHRWRRLTSPACRSSDHPCLAAPLPRS